MASLKIFANACTFGTSEGGWTSMQMDFDQITNYIAERVIDCKNVAAIETAREEMRRELVAADPARSFTVSARLERGQRAPNGFRKIARLDYDHTAQAVQS
jgi:hypothetical protein